MLLYQAKCIFVESDKFDFQRTYHGIYHAMIFCSNFKHLFFFFFFFFYVALKALGDFALENYYSITLAWAQCQTDKIST